MGLFQKIKELFSAKAFIQKAMEEYDKQLAIYAAMSTEELATLSDEDLLSAAAHRAEKAMTEALGEDRSGTPADWVQVLPKEIAAIYTLWEFDAEMLLGEGLAEFFEDDNRCFAPTVGNAQALVGAEEHRALYEGFLIEHQVDVYNTAHFPSPATEAAVLTFNKRYRALPPLEGFLARYARENLEKI